MSFINVFLGLFTPWLIIQLAVCGGAHFYVFLKSLKMRNDPMPYLYRPLASRDGHNNTRNNDQEMAMRNPPSQNNGVIGGVPKTELYDRLRDQRAQFFEQSR